MLPNLLPPDLCINSSRKMITHRKIRRNQGSNLINERRIDARIIKEEVDNLESQSHHYSMRQDEGGGGIAPKNQELVYMCKNAVYVDKS